MIPMDKELAWSLLFGDLSEKIMEDSSADRDRWHEEAKTLDFPDKTWDDIAPMKSFLPLCMLVHQEQYDGEADRESDFNVWSRTSITSYFWAEDMARFNPDDTYEWLKEQGVEVPE